MKEEYKKYIKIGLLIYVVFSLFDIINHFEIESLDFISKLSRLSIPISTIILLAYASDKEESNLCKIGFTLAMVNIVIELLYIFNIVEHSLVNESVISKIVDMVDYYVSSGISLCAMIALFSLIPYNEKPELKKIAIFTFIFSSFIWGLTYITKIDSVKWIMAIRFIAGYVSNMAEYAFICLYLLNKVTPNIGNDMVYQNVEVPNNSPMSEVPVQTIPQPTQQMVMPNNNPSVPPVNGPTNYN